MHRPAKRLLWRNLCLRGDRRNEEKEMISSITERKYRAMYRLLNRVNPVDYDCGTLCGAACCTCEDAGGEEGEPQMGMYLLPGEEKLFTMEEDWLHWSVEDAEDYDFPESWQGDLYFVTCLNRPHCPREKRPLQCRFFPLAPHLDENDTLRLILSDVELPYVCPLIAQNMELTPEFIKATYTVWKHLIHDELIYDLVAYDSSYRDEEELEFLI